jgi:hypothetical protein
MADSMFSVQGVKNLINPAEARARAAQARQQELAAMQSAVQSAPPMAAMQPPPPPPSLSTEDKLRLRTPYLEYVTAEQVAGRQPKEIEDWAVDMRGVQSPQAALPPTPPEEPRYIRN